MTDSLYSVRMRASLAGAHVSGAERIIPRSGLTRVAGELIGRALSHERGRPDSIVLSVDTLAGREPVRLAPLPVSAAEENTFEGGRAAALNELELAGVSMPAALAALEAILSGAAQTGGNMRGAMIIDSVTGERLEPDMERGVRARAVDYADSALGELARSLNRRGLDRSHFREALALATKVAHAPGAVAELCISDDPSYVTGYAASPGRGYVRITPVKAPGDPMGGRAFFVDSSVFDMDRYLYYMRETPVLIEGQVEFR